MQPSKLTCTLLSYSAPSELHPTKSRCFIFSYAAAPLCWTLSEPPNLQTILNDRLSSILSV